MSLVIDHQHSNIHRNEVILLCVPWSVNEHVPRDVTHVTVDENVAAIKDTRKAFINCFQLISFTMGENVKKIESRSLCGCYALRFIRLSKTLESIGFYSFDCCKSLQVLFLPSALKNIGMYAFSRCAALRLIILPDEMDVSNIGEFIVFGSGVHIEVARAAGVNYEDKNGIMSPSSNRSINEWLIKHMDELLHKLCYSSSVSSHKISNYLLQNGYECAARVDLHHGMNPMHLLALNPYASVESISILIMENIDMPLVRALR